MNDENDRETLRLQQMLESVTAADASVAGDVETASLREAWLAFGQLAEAADASLPPPPNLMTSIVPQKGGRIRWPALLAATAAALLVAVTCGWWISRDGKQQGGHESDHAPSLAENAAPQQTARQATKQDLPEPPVARAERTPGAKSTAGKAATATWDDPLETQIASVSQQISNLEQNWQHHMDDVDLVQYRIDEMSDSLQSDTL